jgi:N-acetylglucosamine-6-phosphate deacetylase
MSTTLYYSHIITPHENIPSGAIVVSDEGTIQYVGPMDEMPRTTGVHLDLRGLSVIPGLIDVHVHGGNGITFGGTDSPLDELQSYSKWAVSNGVTGYLCSLVAPDAKSLEELVRKYVEAFSTEIQGAEPLGIHLEGPFINRVKKGAFNPDWLRLPSLEETEQLLKVGKGWIRQVTIAPELQDADLIASRFRQAGVIVSLGHTNSDYTTAMAALRGNYTHVTHTFNAQSNFNHREPGAMGAILSSDNVTAELIADTIHVHPGTMKILWRCLGPDRIVLITDAMAGAGLKDGLYDLVGQTVIVKNGHATLAYGTIAGSTVTLNQCVINMHRYVGVPLPDSVKMATLNPARSMGFSDRLGSLSIGKDANLTVIGEDATIRLTMIRGNIVFSNL